MGALLLKQALHNHHHLWAIHLHPYKKGINLTFGYQVTSHRGHLILFILEHPNVQDISTFSKLLLEGHDINTREVKS